MKTLREIPTYCLLILLLIFYIFPILWNFQISIKQVKDAIASPPVLLFKPVTENYLALIKIGFLKPLLNSLIASIVPVFIALLLGAPAAYGLARLRSKRKEDITFSILVTRMAPPIVTLFFFYLTYTRLGLVDTLLGLIIIYLTGNLQLTVWMLKGFFEEVPQEVDEAAMIDGCNKFQVFFRVTLPLVKSGLIVTGLIGFMFNWGEFIWALTLTDVKARTATVAIFQFMAWGSIEWGLLSSAGVVTLIPVLVALFIVRKHLLRGMTLGITK